MTNIPDNIAGLHLSLDDQAAVADAYDARMSDAMARNDHHTGDRIGRAWHAFANQPIETFNPKEQA